MNSFYAHIAGNGWCIVNYRSALEGKTAKISRLLQAVVSMAPCCLVQRQLGSSLTSLQLLIILLVFIACVIIVILLLFDNATKEFEELNNFYQGFQGRKLLLKERKLRYRSTEEVNTSVHSVLGKPPAWNELRSSW